MPEIIRAATRLTCETGLDLVHPVDRVPPGGYPYLTNARVVEEGRIDSRPGYFNYESHAPSPHSMRRLNDPDDSFQPSGYTNIIGSGPNLFAGPQGAAGLVDTGYSTDPLSLLPFHPDGTPETWMYVYDRNKLARVRPDGLVRAQGTPPPVPGSEMTYGAPAIADIDTGQAVGSWAVTDVATGPTLGNRVTDMSGGTGLTIQSILYDAGTTGWAALVPVAGTPALINSAAMGTRMKVILSTGPETVLVREIHPNIGSTTIAGIQYDSGSTGKCTVVLVASPSGGPLATLQRNTVVKLGGTEYVKVLSVELSPDGSTYSFQTKTIGTFAAGASVTGVISWYVYTTSHHSAGETITSHYLYGTIAAAGANRGGLALNGTAINAGVAANRPIDAANDWLHLSFYCDHPENLAYLEIRAYVNVTNVDYYSWTVTPDTFSAGWNEILIPISQANRIGEHTGDSLSNITSLWIIANSNNALIFGFDWWYVSGTYGPTILPNDPVGLSYVIVNRDFEVNTSSVPSPPIRYQLFPLREQILITPQTITRSYNGIPYSYQLDIYRMGGSIPNFTFVGTVDNNPAAPNTFGDSLPDSSIASSPTADFTLLEPWPLLGLPLFGTVNVIGIQVTVASGDNFPTALVSASVILIGGIAFQTYGSPRSPTSLELFANAGVQTGAAYEIAAPVLAAQPLPFAFGPLEGPLVPVAFGLGDPINCGTLYYTNGNNLDAASGLNQIELAPPTEPLISGACWNGLVIVGSRENLYIARYSFLQTLGIPGQTTFQFQKLPSPSGMWSRWAVCAGADGVYFLGRDGIYRATEQGAVSITDHRLYPIFPHDGQPARTTYGQLPPDMTNLPRLRLNAADQDVYFDYSTESGAS